MRARLNDTTRLAQDVNAIIAGINQTFDTIANDIMTDFQDFKRMAVPVDSGNDHTGIYFRVVTAPGEKPQPYTGKTIVSFWHRLLNHRHATISDDSEAANAVPKAGNPEENCQMYELCHINGGSLSITLAEQIMLEVMGTQMSSCLVTHTKPSTNDLNSQQNTIKPWGKAEC